MNESDLDEIYKILTQGYEKSFKLADEQSQKADEKAFTILFTEGLRESFNKVKSIMLDRAIDGRSE